MKQWNDNRCDSNPPFVRDDIGALQIWQMFLLEPSPRVIAFDDVSSQYEGIEL